MNKKELIECLKHLWHACRLDAEYEEIDTLAEFCLNSINSAQRENSNVSDNVDEKEVCTHPMKDRVRTHRGYHCGICGKRF